MESSPSNKKHKKLLITGSKDANVIFCPDCGTVEINVGSTTLRLTQESFKTFSAMLKVANSELDHIQAKTLGQTSYH